MSSVPTLPKTRSGKIMLRLLEANKLGLDPKGITTLEEWRRRPRPIKG